MDTVQQQALKGLRMLHLHHAPESKTLRIFEILPQHVIAGTIGLVFYIAKHLIQHGQFVVLVYQ